MAGDKRDPAQDPHRAERDDERVYAETDNHQPVNRAARDADAERNGQANREGLRPWHRSERPQHERRGYAGQRVDRTNREVDAA